jgi:hypothetical protein
MTHAMRLYEPRGPEVLVPEKFEVGQPYPGEARVQHRII